METDLSIPRYAYHKPFKSTSLASVNGRTGSTQAVKGAWSAIHTGPRPIKALVLGCINGLKKGAKLKVWTFINEYT
jgi:hypothetical protein